MHFFLSQKFSLVAITCFFEGTNTFQQSSTPGPELVYVPKFDYRAIIFTPVKEQFYDSKSVVFLEKG